MNYQSFLLISIATLSLGACTQGGSQGLDNLDTQTTVVRPGDLEESDLPTFRNDTTSPIEEPAVEDEKIEDVAVEEGSDTENPDDADSGTNGKIKFMPNAFGTYYQKPATELEFRLMAYGETVGQKYLSVLSKSWNECGANFDPMAHETEFNNEFLCFLKNSDPELSDLFEKVDGLAGQARFLYHLLINSQIGSQTEEAFANTLNERINLLTSKLHEMVELNSLARSRIMKHAMAFDNSLNLVALGDWETSDTYNYIIKEYLEGMMFSSTALKLTNKFRDHHIEGHMGWQYHQLRKTFVLVHLAGSLLVGPANDTKNFISFIQFDVENPDADAFMVGEECQGSLKELMGTHDFAYMHAR